jgi:hypothetical protein
MSWKDPGWKEAAREYHAELTPNGKIAHGEQAKPNKPQPQTWRDRIFSGADLQTMTFPAMKWVLPGILPEGATLLVSRPKLGKSWIVLDLALATAAGRFTLGELKPFQGDVLYLALEDGKRRLQRRLTKLLPTFTEAWPTGLQIATEWPRADQSGLSDIEQWITSRQNPRLIVIDTLAQFRRVSSGKTQVYADDYAAIADLQKLASTHNVAIVIVHHDRKAEADDVFDTVSGTLGLTGAADTILIMKRQGGIISLHIRGRDIEEGEKALQFSKTSCKWTIMGEAADFRRSEERGRVLSVLREASEPITAQEIWRSAELRTRNATDILLGKMHSDGEIIRVARGRYTLPPGKNGQIDRSEPKHQKNHKINLSPNLSDVLSPDRFGSANGEQLAGNDPGPIPAFLDRTQPKGGPPGDSLDDFQ